MQIKHYGLIECRLNTTYVIAFVSQLNCTVDDCVFVDVPVLGCRSQSLYAQY